MDFVVRFRPAWSQLSGSGARLAKLTLMHPSTSGALPAKEIKAKTAFQREPACVSMYERSLYVLS